MSEELPPVELIIYSESARDLFSELYAMRDLPDTLLSVFHTVAEACDYYDNASNPTYNIDTPLPARYYHPDDMKKHYKAHTVDGKTCPCHPDNRTECDVCQLHNILVAYESPMT